MSSCEVVPLSLVTVKGNLFLEVDVDIIGAIIGRVKPLLHAPVMSILFSYKVVSAAPQNLLTIVDVVDFLSNFACEHKVVGINNLDSSIKN